MICGLSENEFWTAIERFHGFKAPGIVLGSFMVDRALELIGKGVEADAIVETRHCLPDAVQLFTPCTIGNGWMKIVDWDKFALTLYDRHTRKGYRVWLDLEKTRPHEKLHKWYMRLIRKKDLPLEVLLEVIVKAGTDVFSEAAVEVVEKYERERKNETRICPDCGEAYPMAQGAACLACRGKGYYRRL